MNIWQRYSIRSFFSKPLVSGMVLGLMLLISVWLSLCFGSVNISLSEAIEAAIQRDWGNTSLRIMLYARLPRVLGAMLSGSALAVAGVLIQAVLNNPMAAPNIIGVNAGGGLVAILMIALFPSAITWMPLGAFLGAMGACLCIYAIAVRIGGGRNSITLVGIAISSILTAGINVIKTVFPDTIYNANTFLVGGLQGLSFERLSPAWMIILAGLFFSLILARDIDVLSLGADVAASLGMQVGMMRLLLLALASALAGSAVSFAGLLGFVGLLVPHMARRLVGCNHRRLIPVAATGGGVLVLMCDLLCRVLFAPYEIPVGILLSFIGGPFFILLILLQRKTEVHDNN